MHGWFFRIGFSIGGMGNGMGWEGRGGDKMGFYRGISMCDHLNCR